MTIPPFNSIIVFSIITGYAIKTAVPQFVCTQNWFCASMMVFWSISIPWLFCSAYLYPFHLSPFRHLPTVKGGNWLLGHIWTEVTSPIGHAHKDWTYSIPNEGLVRYLSIFNSERLIITSTKGLSEVLVTNCYDYQKPPLAGRSLRRIIGDGLVLAEGDVHKVQRKNMMPAFAFRHVKELYPVFWAKSREGALAMTEELLSNLGKPHLGEKKEEKVAANSPLRFIGTDQGVLDTSSWASRITLDIIGIASAGIDFGAIHDPTGRLFTTYQKLFQVSTWGKISDILSILLPPWLGGIVPSQRRREIAEASDLIKSVARNLLRTKKQKLEKEKGSVGNDILSIALESGAFSEENLIDQMMTFLAAGHETTGSAMTWAVYMLCLYPAMQTRLREEVRANLPSLNTETSVTSFDIDHLPFLNAFCNELLRYWPPVALTYREASVDTVLLGRRIPKGTTFLIAPIATNRNTELWGPDAGKFDPERWLSNGSGGATSNFSNATFLHGPRSCIGQSFSKAEFACLLATWIGRFEFEFNDLEQKDENQILVKGGGSMRPRGGMFVRTRIVDGW